MAFTWAPLITTNMEIPSGSPLDFTAILPNPIIDEATRIIINDSGRLATISAPNAPVKMLCASLGWGPASGGFPNHEDADRYAIQLARHGYNCARFTFVDANLMDGQNTDFDYNADILDRVRYMMYALKKNGIYWIADGLTSERGAYGGYDDRWEFIGDLRLKTNFESESFGHWLRFQVDIFCTINTYTGMVPLNDPALIGIIPFNESSLSFLSQLTYNQGGPYFNSLLKEPFNKWLLEKYTSTTALQAAWGSELASTESIENQTIELPTTRYGNLARLKDLARFFTEAEKDTTVRMTNCYRAMGFKGFIAPFNNTDNIISTRSRQPNEAVTIDIYKGWVTTESDGDHIEQTSSIADTLSYIQSGTSVKIADKPFIVAEHDHLFWNQYRYESGLAISSYAALNGWDIICRHAAGPVILEYGENYPHKKYMMPYAPALDPIARAGETLAALLFRRGDISESNAFILREYMDQDAIIYGLDTAENQTIATLGLLAKVGLGALPNSNADMTISYPRPNWTMSDAVTQLRNNGVLPTNNITDPVNGIYQSDTGEILLSTTDKKLVVVTPFSEAIAFGEIPSRVTLGQVTINYATNTGLFAVCSLDGNNLTFSSKMLVIYATNAQNTNQTYADSTEQVITNYGELPVMIRVDHIGFTVPNAGDWQLSPIMVNGELKSAIASGTGNIAIELWTNTPSDCPTTFFLLERLS